LLRQILSVTPIMAVALLAACQKPPAQLYVDGGYVRLNANPDNPAAGYFTIHGGADAVTLRAVQTDAAVRLELHESVLEGGVMEMRPIESVDVPAGETVSFKPGGKHVMLWQINPQAIAAGKMTFKFIFSNGDQILADAEIQGPDGKVTGQGPAPTAGTDIVETKQIK
jgi:periplasmic copper chaperone A